MEGQGRKEESRPTLDSTCEKKRQSTRTGQHKFRVDGPTMTVDDDDLAMAIDRSTIPPLDMDRSRELTHSHCKVSHEAENDPAYRHRSPRCRQESQSLIDRHPLKSNHLSHHNHDHDKNHNHNQDQDSHHQAEWRAVKKKPDNGGESA
jgi:hypothetical protein